MVRIAPSVAKMSAVKKSPDKGRDSAALFSSNDFQDKNFITMKKPSVKKKLVTTGSFPSSAYRSRLLILYTAFLKMSEKSVD